MVKEMWATEEQADASKAMAKLSHFMKEVNGDWKPEWLEAACRKYVIYVSETVIVATEYRRSIQCFLAFNTEEIRNAFMKKHKSLIAKAKPLL